MIDVGYCDFPMSIERTFVKKTSRKIRHALLTKCKKGSRRNYSTRTIKDRFTVTFTESPSNPVRKFLETWLDAALSNENV